MLCEKIQAMINCLDNAHVPIKGRIVRFTGKDGKEYEVSLDKETPSEIQKQVPDWLNTEPMIKWVRDL